MKLLHSTNKLALTIAISSFSTLLHAAPADSEWESLKARVAQLEEHLDTQGETSQSTTTIGGYGELHYNNLDNQLPGAGDERSIDMHRFVLFVGHEFSPAIKLFSELEVEHSFIEGGVGGEVALEQAYLDFALNDSMSVKAGMFLMPVGLINETHEPPAFYGVERNAVEHDIIPATWSEGGVMFSGHSNSGLSYDLALHSGLNTTDYDVRESRQSVSEATANALATTARIKWTGVAGLELSASLNHQNDITQGAATKIAGNLLEAHLVYSTGPFTIKALLAGWKFDDNGSANGMDKQRGGYIEPSYKLSEKVGVFMRHSRWDNAAGDNIDSQFRQNDIGINYWPHPDVVLKADYQNQTAPAGEAAFDGFNLGIGFQF